ncbi:hypothetical protein FLA_4632 [Filimonas lacunae]|nr:hypothetical protein FLA_4632 [Filimonas lacunae]
MGLGLLVMMLCAFEPDDLQNIDIWDTPTNVSVVKCYPNPAISYINFEFPQQIDKDYTLYIYSFVGKKMTELQVTNRKLILPLTGYYRGIYVFQLRDKTGKIIETGKFQVEQ